MALFAITLYKYASPFFVVNFVASFVEIGLDEVRDKACNKGNL